MELGNLGQKGLNWASSLGSKCSSLLFCFVQATDKTETRFSSSDDYLASRMCYNNNLRTAYEPFCVTCDMLKEEQNRAQGNMVQ